MKKRNAIIMGAAGRDLHNFNVFFRKNPLYNVVAFTAEQIPGIDKRIYPSQLSGPAYPRGIPIYAESELPELIRKNGVKEVFLSYSDLSNETVMQKAAVVIANGATFSLLGTKDSYIKSRKPVVAVCAVRTGCGKSPLSRFIVNFLRTRSYKVAVIRHPMPYGDLSKQVVQRFATFDDLDRQECTIEEREEYEPHIRNGAVVYAGVDYERILQAAEKEADVILWDGGNNDFSFYKPDLMITVADPHRPGHELLYYPGESNFLMADVIVISKVNTAKKANVKIVEDHAKQYNPKAKIVKSSLEISVSNENIKNKKVIVIEDGPTLTHGGMKYGAGTIAAKKHGARPIDPRKYAIGSIKDIYKKYGHLGSILPAMGYSRRQIKELEQTINRAKCDFIVDGTPADLGRLMKISKPVVDVDYKFSEIGSSMTRILSDFEKKMLRKRL
jgi:predicted GTPase